MKIGKIKFSLCILHFSIFNLQFQIFNNIAKGDALEAQIPSPVLVTNNNTFIERGKIE